MSTHLDTHGQLHHAGTGLTLNCPHCQVLAHMTPVSTPLWSVLRTHRPTHIGIVYRCDACNSPVFIKYPVKFYTEQRIELGTQFVELEHPRERFNYTYLPSNCELLFKEALQCYSHGAYNGFASLCRRATQTLCKDLGDNGRTKVVDLLVQIRELAGLDQECFNLITRILLDKETDMDTLPTLDALYAGVLLEVMKDLLYQCYIRRGKLKQALQMRRYFADERSNNVTPLKAVT
ncbi:MAG: hypothetical protein AB7F79_12340 [Steroidobacteraceae bacterium]